MTEKKKNWLIASLAVFMLAVGIVIAIATGVSYVFVGVVVLLAAVHDLLRGTAGQAGR